MSYIELTLLYDNSVIPLGSKEGARSIELWGDVITIAGSHSSTGNQEFIPTLIQEELYRSIQEVFLTPLWKSSAPNLLEEPLSPLTPLPQSDLSDEDIPELNLASKGKRRRSSSSEDEPPSKSIRYNVTDSQPSPPSPLPLEESTQCFDSGAACPPPGTERRSKYPVPSNIQTIVIDVELSKKLPYKHPETSREWTNKERVKCEKTLRKAASSEELQRLVSFVYLFVYLFILFTVMVILQACR